MAGLEEPHVLDIDPCGVQPVLFLVPVPFVEDQALSYVALLGLQWKEAGQAPCDDEPCPEQSKDLASKKKESAQKAKGAISSLFTSFEISKNLSKHTPNHSQKQD
ncbi:MAG TPA: hypothetical protein VJC06_04170 [Candidatus Paceibacterota bacterium]